MLFFPQLSWIQQGIFFIAQMVTEAGMPQCLREHGRKARGFRNFCGKETSGIHRCMVMPKKLIMYFFLV